MIPLIDKNRRKHFPFITIIFILLCSGVFILLFFFNNDYNKIIYNFSFIPSRIANISESYRFITYIFFHGSIFHLLGNMIFLWVFGDNIEDKLGRIKYIEFILLSAVISILVHTGISIIMKQTDIPVIGASGVISAIIGSYLVFYPNAKIITLVFIFLIIVPAWVFIIVWFIMQLINGFANLSNTQVAYFAHIGGFIFGYIYAIKYKLISKSNIN